MDQITVYTYGPNADPENDDGSDYTVLTKKATYSGTSSAGTKLSETTNTYNYQGRLETAQVDQYTSGTLSDSDLFTYTYNDSGIRVDVEAGAILTLTGTSPKSQPMLRSTLSMRITTPATHR